MFDYGKLHGKGMNEFGMFWDDWHVHGLNKERGDQVKKSSIVGASLTSQSCHLSPILFIALSFFTLS